MRKPILLFLALLFAVPLMSQTAADAVQTFSLQNGMNVVVLEDHSIPNATMQFYWKVGSRNEVPGITGLSHFFEHMMFNGAKKYGPKEFDRVMEAGGGSNNAFTSEDMTAYLDWFPSNAMEVMFDLEADRIGHLALVDSMVESERGVVLSEWTTRRENSNYSLLEEQVRSSAFTAHPYRWSVIGYESDIRNWTINDLQWYFETYYAPNNAVVVVVGDVTVDEVRLLCRSHFESIPPHAPPRPIHTVEPEQMGEKRVWVEKDVSSPNVMVAYHAPKAQSDDFHAVMLLSALLSEGQSSRLYNALVDNKQLAVQVLSSFSEAFDPTLLVVYAVCAEGVHEDSLLKAYDAEIADLVHRPVSEDELQKVKNRKRVDLYRYMATIDGKAQLLGSSALFYGDPRIAFSTPEAYERVTVQDVQRVAVKYLTISNRTVGVLKKKMEEHP